MNLKKSIIIGLAVMAAFSSFGCGDSGQKSSGGFRVVTRPQTPQQKAEAEEALSQGRSYFATGKYSEAIDSFTKAINAKENNAYIYYERGHAYECLEDIPSAIADYTTAINTGKTKIKQYEQDSNDPDLNTVMGLGEAAFRRGYIYHQQRDLINAIEDYTKVIDLCIARGNKFSVPPIVCASSYNNRGNCYCDQGDFARAIADYSKAIEIGRNPIYYRNRGIAHQQLGNEAQAEADLAMAQELEEKNAKK